MSIKKYSLHELERMRAKFDYTVVLNPPPFAKEVLEKEIEMRKTNKVKNVTIQATIPFKSVYSLK